MAIVAPTQPGQDFTLYDGSVWRIVEVKGAELRAQRIQAAPPPVKQPGGKK